VNVLVPSAGELTNTGVPPLLQNGKLVCESATFVGSLIVIGVAGFTGAVTSSSNNFLLLPDVVMVYGSQPFAE
jgi:hypothetical protein